MAAPGYLGHLSSNLTGEPVGTCFQLSPGVLVTAAHVLERIGASKV
jgi:hypothetical protein